MSKVDKKLKHRVVGAIVLTALAIVILPMLLDGSVADRAKILSRIPDPPVIYTQDLRVEDVLKQMEKQQLESEARFSNADSSGSESDLSVSEKTDSPDQPLTESLNASLKLDSDGLPIAWSLQVGSFSKRENALKLRESLRSNSHQSYIYKAKVDAGDIYRVFIGPVMSKIVLEAVADQVRSEYGLEGRIVRYNTNEDKNLIGG